MRDIDGIFFSMRLSPERTTLYQPVKERAVELIAKNELTGMAGGKFVFPVVLAAQ